MGLLIAVLSGFIVACVAPWVHRATARTASWLLALLPLALTVHFASLAPAVIAGDTIRVSFPWVPTLGVNLSFLLDGLSLLFALLITGTGALVVIYGGHYLAGHRDLARFYAVLLAFMASMLGLVLADNVVTLFVFWELTSITSYLLIGFDHERESARKAALQALLVTGVGGLALLAGVLMMAHVGGSLELSELAAQADLLRAHPLYFSMLLLVLAGAFTKSAQFPFHFWLPAAMEAPTPVSAYLHSATMVKAGIYLLARLTPTLGGTEPWLVLLASVGTITMLVGGVLALRERDMKLALAYSTVAALGTITLLIGLGQQPAIAAALVFLGSHALYKGALFLTVGAIDHEAGTRDVLRLGGLRRRMPITATAAVVAALSMAGLPPVIGFVAKELFYEATLGLMTGAALLTTAAMLGNALTVAVACIVGLRPFFGALRAPSDAVHEAPLGLWLGPVSLAVLGVVSGLLPAIPGRTLITPAVSAVLREPVTLDLHLWPGWKPALLLSVLTVAAGAAIYLAWPLTRRTLQRADAILARGPAWWYERALDGLVRFAGAQTRILQHGYLRFYMMVVFLALFGAGAAALVTRGGLPASIAPARGMVHEWILSGVILVAALAAIKARSRLMAVASLGVVGFSIAQLFVTFGAPDVAITQFLVETLIVIIVALVLVHLPHFEQTERLRAPARLRDAVLALGVGALVTILVLAVLELRFDPFISEYYATQSVPAAHGRNIVNVILVDFRALDTLGEITVLAVAGLGVFALLKLRPPADPSGKSER